MILHSQADVNLQRQRNNIFKVHVHSSDSTRSSMYMSTHQVSPALYSERINFQTKFVNVITQPAQILP